MSISKSYEFNVLDKFKNLLENYPNLIKRGDWCVHWSLNDQRIVSFEELDKQNVSVPSYVLKFPVVDVGGEENMEAMWKI